MPQIIKPRTLGLLHKVERRRNGARFVICAIAAFDLADPSKLDGEQALWLMAADALPPGTALDMCMPKPRAEMLIAGKIHAPHTTGMMLEARFAGLSKRLAVFGDRWWAVEDGQYFATEPRPIGELLLSPQRAFGGEGHPTNAGGRGFGAADMIGRGEAVPLPNIEDPAALIHSPLDQPPPAGFGPLDLMDPERQRLAGTYDAAWMRDVAPALADDVHPDFFMNAPEGQRLTTYLTGDEAYWLRNFASATPELEGRLPGIRPRAFLGQTDGPWSEVTLSLDTVWFVAGARRGILVWHGVAPVEDIEGKDVSDVLLAYERLGDTPRSLAHYAEVRRLRRDPETAVHYAFSEWQLTPLRDPAEEARRKAARMAVAEQEAGTQAEAMAYLTARALDEAGIPEALRPPAPLPPAPSVILPTPQELADGDFDLGEILDAIEAETAKVHEMMRETNELDAQIREAVGAFNKPQAGAAEVDAFFAVLGSVNGQDLAGDLDRNLGPMAALSIDLPEGATLSDEAAAALARHENFPDWHELAIQTLAPPDRERLLAEAEARFLRLPEASPLAAARAALKEIEIPRPKLPVDLQDMPKPAAPPETPIADLLARLAADPNMPQDVVAQTTEKMAEAQGALTKAFPGLAEGGGSALDALLSEFSSAPPPPEAPDLERQLAQAEEQIRDAGRRLDEAEPRLVDGIAEMRRLSPTAGYPERLFPAQLAKRFGDRVLGHVRTGLDLRGRDLAGVDLAGADLSGLDLSGALLERANLANVRLKGANLSRAVLTQARLEGADLSDAVLDGANLSHINGRFLRLDGARISGALMVGARLIEASAHGAVFADLQLLEADLSGTDLCEAKFDEVVLIQTKATGTNLRRATLRRCQIVECDLSDARLSDALVSQCAFVSLNAPRLNATDADMRGVAFVGEAKLAGADFSGALTGEAGFFGADLSGARFSRAICDGTLFNEAHLAGADFRFASLRRALFDSASLEGADFAGAQMMEAQLHRARLPYAFLRGANLYGADLSDADLYCADLTGSNLTNSPLALETVHA